VIHVDHPMRLRDIQRLEHGLREIEHVIGHSKRRVNQTRVRLNTLNMTKMIAFTQDAGQFADIL